MTVEFQPLDMDSAEEVVRRMWQRGAEEAMIFGIQTDEEMLDYIHAREHDVFAWIVTLDGQPISAFGAFESAPCIYRTWFIATDEFEECFMPLTRKLKKIIENAMKISGAIEVETYSACIHPMAKKWFRLLGLTEDHDYSDDSLTRFHKQGI